MSTQKTHSPIWIIGYMGSGKSTVGKLLSERLECAFLDSDQWIEEQSGKTVAELFEQEGEAAFRLREKQFVEELPAGRSVISCGGGLPCFHELMDRLLEDDVIYLEASVETLAERLKAQTSNRPLLKGLTGEELPEAIRKRLETRVSVYERAGIILPVDGKSPGMIVTELIPLLI